MNQKQMEIVFYPKIFFLIFVQFDWLMWQWVINPIDKLHLTKFLNCNPRRNSFYLILVHLFERRDE